MTHSRTLAALFAVPLLSLAACGGGGDSDSDKISKIVKDGAKNPATICDHLDATLVKQLGGLEGCKKAAKQADDGDTKTDDLKVTVNGEKATAKFKTKQGQQSISFIKVDGHWKVTATQ